MSTLFSAAFSPESPAQELSAQQQIDALHLPDPLMNNAGEKVSNLAQWRARRSELLELFRVNVYGRAPVGRPEKLSFVVENVDKTALDGAATLKEISIRYVGPGGVGGLHLMLFVPNKRTKPAPCFLLMNNRGIDKNDTTKLTKGDFWPAKEIIMRGYATAAFNVSDVDPDSDDDFRNGAHGIFDVGSRNGASWGTLAAWAWGASRAMDYLETDTDINAQHIAVLGHSRGGKAALWAGAQDERFALTISNDSGAGGASLSRGKSGENVKRINTNFPHWFARNYRNFNDREADLPIDQHELVALVAPRLVYVASAQDDAWADPHSEWLSTLAASRVYKMLGLGGISPDEIPQVDVPQRAGSIGHHVRHGGHDLTLYDWQQYMNFADAHWGKS